MSCVKYTDGDGGKLKELGMRRGEDQYDVHRGNIPFFECL